MNMKVEIEKSLRPAVKHWAAESKTSVDSIVNGIVSLFMVRDYEREEKQNVLVRSVLDAVAVFRTDIVKEVERSERSEKRWPRALTDEQVEQVLMLRDAGLTYPELAQRFNVSVPTVRRATGSLKSRRR
jgi:DNA-directed RNA polymerase specialized sigma24 family protein